MFTGIGALAAAVILAALLTFAVCFFSILIIIVLVRLKYKINHQAELEVTNKSSNPKMDTSETEKSTHPGLSWQM